MHSHSEHPEPVGLPHHPSRLALTPPRGWKLRVFRVRGEAEQRRIMASFLRIGRVDVAVSATRSDDDWFVVVEYTTRPSEAYVMRVVLTIDPGAVRTYESESPQDRRATRSGAALVVPLAGVDDAELLRRARDGESVAFDVLCSRHSYAARRLCRQLGLGRDGLRIVADAFARALVLSIDEREFRREAFGLIRAESRRSRSAQDPPG